MSGEAQNVHPSKINENNEEIKEEKQKSHKKLLKKLNITVKEESKPELQHDLENYQKEVEAEQHQKQKEEEEKKQKIEKEKEKYDENYMHNMRNEINFLKMEGNYMKANILEKKLNEIYLQNLQDK